MSTFANVIDATAATGLAIIWDVMIIGVILYYSFYVYVGENKRYDMFRKQLWTYAIYMSEFLIIQILSLCFYYDFGSVRTDVTNLIARSTSCDGFEPFQCTCRAGICFSYVGAWSVNLFVGRFFIVFAAAAFLTVNIMAAYFITRVMKSTGQQTYPVQQPYSASLNTVIQSVSLQSAVSWGVIAVYFVTSIIVLALGIWKFRYTGVDADGYMAWGVISATGVTLFRIPTWFYYAYALVYISPHVYLLCTRGTTIGFVAMIITSAIAIQYEGAPDVFFRVGGFVLGGSVLFHCENYRRNKDRINNAMKKNDDMQKMAYTGNMSILDKIFN